jgi:hypothetical protein
MLAPVFFQLPVGLILNEGDRYTIRGYAQFERWTLVSWRIDVANSAEPIYGESLWRDRTLIASGAGAIDLWTPPTPREPLDPDDPPPPPIPENPFDRIPSNHTNYGVSQVCAVALRDDANFVWFDLA